MMHPKLLDGFNCESKGENIGRRRSWGASLGSEYFGGRRARWSFGMGTKKIEKQVNYSYGPSQTK